MTQTRTLRALVGGAGQRLARGTKRLPKTKKKAAIAAKRGVGKPSVGAIKTEFRTLYSSDGIFRLDYQHVLGAR